MTEPTRGGDERDACALVAVARKDGRAGPDPLALVLHGLDRMAHRSGEIDGEGDGAGVLVDIPRALWAGRLADAGLSERLAVDPRFAVAHLFVPHDAPADTAATIRAILDSHRLRIVLERDQATSASALLARYGRDGEPEGNIPKVSQEALAALVGTTRSRVRLLLDKFRALGFIHYNGTMQVHRTLLNVVLHD